MEFSGLLTQYRVNRPLTDEEKSQQLSQQRQLNVPARDHLCVIKMNSTYLEVIDKWFAWRGVVSGIAICTILMCVGGFGSIAAGLMWSAFHDSSIPDESRVALVNGIGMALLSILTGWAGGWLLLKEAFRFTHYPIRFNRRTQMVHVFRTDGTTLSVPWSEVHFVIAELPAWNEREIQGHVLDSAARIIVETFPLGYVGLSSSRSAVTAGLRMKDSLSEYWEFIRCYMHEGPETLSATVRACMPISNEREPLMFGVRRCLANIAGAPVGIHGVLALVCLAIFPFRFIAMRTSRIPRWPVEVEAAAPIESGDPYAIEGDVDGVAVQVFRPPLSIDRF